MKKIIIIIATIAAMSLMTVSCKNPSKSAAKCGENTECSCNHEGGECTKPDGEKCAKCLEAEANAEKQECNHEGGEHQCNGNHENCQHNK